MRPEEKMHYFIKTVPFVCVRVCVCARARARVCGCVCAGQPKLGSWACVLSLLFIALHVGMFTLNVLMI